MLLDCYIMYFRIHMFVGVGLLSTRDTTDLVLGLKRGFNINNKLNV